MATRTALRLAAAAVSVLQPASAAWAQVEEIIQDETASEPPGEAIDDETASAPLVDETSPRVPLGPALVGGRVHQRTLLDTAFEKSRGEDVLEARTRTGLHVDAPLTPRIGTRLSARLDHRLLVPENGSHARGSLEPRLLDAYVDADLGRLDLRVGQQVIAWGRVDVLPTADFLNPPDLTDGLATDLETAVVPVPAIRADYAMGEAFSIAVVYEPFFVPARVELFGSDFALIGPGASAATRAQAAALVDAVDASIVEDVQDELLATEVPDEWFVNGQVGGRLEMRGPEGAVALSGFWGYEKIPTLDAGPVLRDYLADPEDLATLLTVLDQLQRGEELYRSHYRRMAVLALDGEAPAGPILLRFDVGLTPERTLYQVDETTGCALPCPVRSGIVQVAVQAEYTEGETWFVTGELVVLHATKRPPPPGELLVFGASGTLPGAAVAVRRSFLDGDLEISLFSFVTWDPASLIGSAGASYRLAEGVRVEGGGLVFEGFGEEASPGGQYDPNDAAYAGIRYDF